MPARKKSKSPTFLLILLIIGIGIILSIQTFRRAAHRLVSDFFYPFLAVNAESEEVIANKSLLLESKLTLAANIEDLQRRNDELQLKMMELEETAEKHKELRKLAKLPAGRSYKMIFAELFLADPPYWGQHFVINKGSDHGIKEFDIVVARADVSETGIPVIAVVGRITQLSKHTATVSTIVNPEMKLSVWLPQSRALGRIEGGGRDGSQLWAQLSFLPRDKQYQPGERVYTTGLGNWTPPNLLVGTLKGDETAEITTEGNLYSEAKVIPAVDLNRIRFVCVMTRRGAE